MAGLAPGLENLDLRTGPSVWVSDPNEGSEGKALVSRRRYVSPESLIHTLAALELHRVRTGRSEGWKRRWYLRILRGAVSRLLIAIAIIFTASCGTSPAPVALVPPPAPEYPPPYTSVFYGDSYVQQGAWPDWFRPALNRGFGGARVDQVAAQISEDKKAIAFLSSTRVYLWCGINDAIQSWDRYSTVQAYGRAIDELHQAGAVDVVCLSVLPVGHAFAGVYGRAITPDQVAVLDAELEAVAGAHHARWIDLRPAIAGVDGYAADQFTLPQGIHLTAAGYDQVVPLLMAVPQ